MILSLRRRHRITTGALSLLVPAVFVLALLARKPIPHQVVAEGTVRSVVLPGFTATKATDVGWATLPLRSTWYLRDADRSVAVLLECTKPLQQPDLLLYWEETSEPLSALTDGAILLGGFGGRPRGFWELPENRGTLALYSLAKNELIDSIQLPELLEATP